MNLIVQKRLLYDKSHAYTLISNLYCNANLSDNSYKPIVLTAIDLEFFLNTLYYIIQYGTKSYSI